jgi:hypothetical protein
MDCWSARSSLSLVGGLADASPDGLLVGPQGGLPDVSSDGLLVGSLGSMPDGLPVASPDG